MKRIELENGDYLEIKLLENGHGIRVSLCGAMGYLKENNYYTDDELLRMFGYSSKRKELKSC